MVRVSYMHVGITIIQSTSLFVFFFFPFAPTWNSCQSTFDTHTHMLKHSNEEREQKEAACR